MDWHAKLAWAEAEHASRVAAQTSDGEREDLRLAGIAGASWAAGLAAMMLGHAVDAARLLRRAADEYVVSWSAAPAGSWGRPIAALRCRLLADDLEGARAVGERALADGSSDADGAIAAYCTALSLLSLERDDDALSPAESLRQREDFEPRSVADALAALARRDPAAYAEAAIRVLGSFEERDAFLEDTPVADTVLVLDALARARGLPPVRVTSYLLPPAANPVHD